MTADRRTAAYKTLLRVGSILICPQTRCKHAIEREQREPVNLLKKAILARRRIAQGEAARWQVAPTSPEYRKARQVIDRTPARLATLDEIGKILRPELPPLRL